MKWTIMNEQNMGLLYTNLESQDLAEAIGEAMNMSQFDNYLDAIKQPYTIGSISFKPHNILKEMDPIHYRMIASDWIDANVETILDMAENGEDNEFCFAGLIIKKEG